MVDRVDRNSAGPLRAALSPPAQAHPSPARSDQARTDRVTAAVTVVMVTFARDHIMPLAVARLAEVVADRQDVEVVLVDNNPDDVDRSCALKRIARPIYLKLGRNKGVAARNDGALAGTGSLIVFVDDDAFLNPDDALSVFERAFAAAPDLGIVTARHIDAASGDTPRASFPHTDKSRRKDVGFRTFRFQGNGFAMRRSVFERVGPMSEDYFYGLEEIDYAYRVIEAGYELSYEPAAWVIEHNDPGGRRPRRAVEQMRLTNKLIISWKHLPARYLALNIVLFSAYVFVLNRGRLNPLSSMAAWIAWVKRNPGRRRPIGPSAQSYIRACGGHVWK